MIKISRGSSRKRRSGKIHIPAARRHHIFDSNAVMLLISVFTVHAVLSVLIIHRFKRIVGVISGINEETISLAFLYSILQALIPGPEIRILRLIGTSGL